MKKNKALRTPYYAYDTNNKEVGKFRTEKQAVAFAKAFAKTATPVTDGYNTVLITHLYWDKDVESLCEDELRSYQYAKKGQSND